MPMIDQLKTRRPPRFTTNGAFNFGSDPTHENLPVGFPLSDFSV
jgi:hypothetical protein